jgi:RiboL-PSP-HEPN
MPTIAELQQELNTEINALENRFLSKWIPAQPEHLPDDYQHDVKAYCVLAHATFEEYAEEISLRALKSAEDAWLSKKFSRATIPLLLYYRAELKVVEEEDEQQERIFDLVRKNIEECKVKHSIALSNNHGFSLKYLRKIFTPVGVDIPDTVKLMESLRELADARGSYAHSQAKQAMYGQWKRAKRSMEPERAKAAVLDCIELCEYLTKSLDAGIDYPQNEKGLIGRMLNATLFKLKKFWQFVANFGN